MAVTGTTSAKTISGTGSLKLPATIVVTIMGTLLIAAAAKISVPVWPVPVTLQSFAIAALAAIFGMRIGVATVLLYLAEGAMGAPIFAAGGGVAHLMGPTGGFLIGFLPFVAIIGLAADHVGSNRILPMFLAMVAATLVLWIFGYAWLVNLSAQTSWIDQSNVVSSAFAKAIQPFIIWDIAKMAFAALTAAGACRMFGGRV